MCWTSGDHIAWSPTANTAPCCSASTAIAPTPGCPNTKNLHAHHRIHWIHGGRTDLRNLLLLCERHHVAHHAGEFEILPDGTGRFRFVSSHGRNLSAPHRRPASRDSLPLEDEYPDIAADAATPRWDGQRLDRRYAISVLAQRRQVAS